MTCNVAKLSHRSLLKIGRKSMMSWVTDWGGDWKSTTQQCSHWATCVDRHRLLVPWWDLMPHMLPEAEQAARREARPKNRKTAQPLVLIYLTATPPSSIPLLLSTYMEDIYICIACVFTFMYLFVFLSIFLFFYLSIVRSCYLAILLFIFLSPRHSFDLSISLCVYLSTYRSIHLTTYLPIYLHTYLPIYPSIYLSICVCACYFLVPAGWVCRYLALYNWSWHLDIALLDIHCCFIPPQLGQAGFRKGQELQQRCQAWQWLRGTLQSSLK